MSDTSDLAEQVATDPDLESALSTIADVDADRDGWTFDDVPVDTGTFGKLVSQGIVEETADGDRYRLANPEVVRAALEQNGHAGDGDAANPSPSLDVTLPSSGRLPALGIAVVVVALVVWTRAYIYPDVFRGSDVVLTANDPYAYRFYLEAALGHVNAPSEVSSVVGTTLGEPLFLAMLWFGATLLGGSQGAAGIVLAWYPVVMGVLVCGLVYVLGARVLGDRRVGLAAAVALAIVPSFAFRTSLGFGDHHAFDYVWLLATITAMAWVVTIDEPFGDRGRQGAALLGCAVAGQVLAWEGSPLLLLPIAGYLAVVVPLDVAADRSPFRENAPVLLGSAVAAVLVLLAHLALGWHGPSVAVVPALLLAGGLGLAGVGELVRRRDVRARTLVAAEVGGPIAALVVLALVLPSLTRQLLGGIGFLLFASNIAEKAPTFTVENALGLEFLGAVFLLALPALWWGLQRADRGDRQWLVVSGYASWLLFLTALQIRFAAHLATVLALYAGVTFIWLLARFDLTALPAPIRRVQADGGDVPDEQSAIHSADEWFDRDALTVRAGVSTLLVLALVVGTSGVYLPGQVEGGLVNEERYHTASWMNDYAAEQGWEYPESYVFSDWGVNRVYNYFVNGVSQNYSRAQRNYSRFIFNDTAASAGWYEQLRDDTGFVVVEPRAQRPGTIQEHLSATYGSRWDGREAVSHYRAVFASSSTRIKVFTLVPGATISGSAPPNTTVEARTTVEIANESFLYRQRAETGSDGEYRMVVPYPAEYELTAANTTWNATVPESAVTDGDRVQSNP